jgi:hypothetical protein
MYKKNYVTSYENLKGRLVTCCISFCTNNFPSSLFLSLSAPQVIEWSVETNVERHFALIPRITSQPLTVAFIWHVIIGRTADFGRWISVAQWSDASRWACAVTLFCLSNNSDVEVRGSLLLVQCVLLPRAVCLFLSLSLCRRDKFEAPAHSHALTVKDTALKLSARLYTLHVHIKIKWIIQ